MAKRTHRTRRRGGKKKHSTPSTQHLREVVSRDVFKAIQLDLEHMFEDYTTDDAELEPINPGIPELEKPPIIGVPTFGMYPNIWEVSDEERAILGANPVNVSNPILYFYMQASWEKYLDEVSSVSYYDAFFRKDELSVEETCLREIDEYMDVFDRFCDKFGIEEAIKVYDEVIGG